ncbi:MAG: hypothetical protein ACE3L7_13080 [Candidatus Pristimantibacillus sp.]
MSKGIEINGVIFANDDSDINHDEFLSAFIKLVESKGWHFGGSTQEVDSDDE